jgi:hypothetical protein
MKSIFTFGKKKRTSRKSKRGTKKKVALPPKKLLKICKALKVKVVTKRGSKRVYKSILVLKKLCLRKIKVLKKNNRKNFNKIMIIKQLFFILQIKVFSYTISSVKDLYNHNLLYQNNPLFRHLT